MDHTIQMILQQLIGATPQKSPLAALEGTAVDPEEDQGAKAQRIKQLMGGSEPPKALQRPDIDVTQGADGIWFYKIKAPGEQWQRWGK